MEEVLSDKWNKDIVITKTTQKGGAEKTTSSISLASGLARIYHQNLKNHNYPSLCL
jgi:hypothetical protein